MYNIIKIIFGFSLLLTTIWAQHSVPPSGAKNAGRTETILSRTFQVSLSAQQQATYPRLVELLSEIVPAISDNPEQAIKNRDNPQYVATVIATIKNIISSYVELELNSAKPSTAEQLTTSLNEMLDLAMRSKEGITLDQIRQQPSNNRALVCSWGTRQSVYVVDYYIWLAIGVGHRVLQVFEPSGGNYQLVAEGGADLNNLEVHNGHFLRLTGNEENDVQFLAFGARPDTHKHLNVLAYRYRNKKLEKIWERKELFEGDVSVAPAAMTLKYHIYPKAIDLRENWRREDFLRDQISVPKGSVILKYVLEKEWSEARMEKRPVPLHVEVYKPTAGALESVISRITVQN